MAKRRVRSAYPARSSSAVGASPGEAGGKEELRAASRDNLLSRVLSVLGAPGGSLLVLRAFLGVTFAFAGLQKLTNRAFFNATAPGSFQQQLRGSILMSPLHHLLDPALHASTPVALVISFGELAVGLGTLLGLFGRIAATGGMLLSLSFFLTVSFNDNPYYYGPDIVFLFAWTPFVLAGSGAWSLDAVFARRAERAHRSVLVAAAQGGPAARHRAAELERRVFLQKASAAGVIGIAGLVAGGVMAAIGRIAGGSQPSAGSGPVGRGSPTASPSTTISSEPKGASTTTSSSVASSGATPKGVRIGAASDVPVGGAASFTDPKEGVPALVVQVKQGVFRAFSAVCPHAGCQVQFDQQSDLFVCPCHGSIFDGSTGAVQQGPASTGLSSIPIALGSNGQLYVDG
ncbi:MAG: Rieske 2Fe-2S domain-containing protein [Acidimicrobiales bacterium]|jgi:thiosulfate dehydrogenase [quinone] large subunit